MAKSGLRRRPSEPESRGSNPLGPANVVGKFLMFGCNFIVGEADAEGCFSFCVVECFVFCVFVCFWG